MIKFGIIGNGGIARVHKESIDIVGGKLAEVCDIDDDYKELIPKVDVVVISTPNYLHYPMTVDALNAGKYVICEKPHALNSEDVRRVIEHPNSDKLYPVLQLRYNPDLQKLRKKIVKENKFHQVEMTIKIHREDPYFNGWKGNTACSGGLLFNIGVHYFDFLQWLFGQYVASADTKISMKEASGCVRLDRACVNWHIDIITPEEEQERKLCIDGEEVNLSYRFQNLHQEIYKELMAGKKSSIDFKDLIKTYVLIEEIMRG